MPVPRHLPSTIAIACLLTTSAFAADQPIVASPVFKAPIAPAPPPPAWLWSGFYVGLHVGGAAGTANFTDPFGPSIFGDTVRTPGFLAGGQIGFNWQAPNSQWVFGIQGDISGFVSEGINTCFAYSGSAINTTCRVTPQVAGAITGRVGYAAGPDGRTLVYVKGGFAWAESHVYMATNNFFAGLIGPPIATNSSSFAVWGGTAGAGVEYALTPAWSLFAEYDYLGFAKNNLTNLGSVAVSPLGVTTSVIPPSSSAVSQNIQEFKLGVNYKLGVEPWSLGPDAPPARLHPFAGNAWAPGWEFAAGVRYMYSWGQFHKDLGQSVVGVSPSFSSISRLTYDDMRTNSGEFFARLENPWDFYIKGFIGGGRTNSGHMNDEDFGIIPAFPFPPYIPYSNTISGNVSGNVGYGVLDAGYDFLHGPTYKAGGFIGYTQFHQVMNAYGCQQIANPLSDCSPAIPNSVLGITENDTWKALRVGMNAEAMVTDRIKVAADVAYLPYVNFKGLDTHWQRVPVILFTETSNGGQGVQLEGLLSYYFTPALSVGVGGRYWAAWTTSGTYSAEGINFTNSFRGAFQQAGAFVQASYEFSVPAGGTLVDAAR